MSRSIQSCCNCDHFVEHNDAGLHYLTCGLTGEETWVNTGSFCKVYKPKYNNADVAPVKHGKWRYKANTNVSFVCYECSECFGLFLNKSNYCPDCGARMEE